MARRRRPPRAGALAELPPLKILSQIAALQALYYAGALVLMLFSSLVSGRGFRLELVLGWAAVRGDTTQGWLNGFMWVLDGGLFMSVAMVLIVIRSKLVLDFALTTHFIHLIVVSLYSGQVPRHMGWWLAMLASSAMGAALGIWGCQYRELRPVFFGGGGNSSNANNSHDGAIPDGDGLPVGDEEQGFSRGRGRGRGRDGAGDYEMVKMNGEAAA
ncbi:integral membrane protein S linking to the trans Golgi network-domain-containing protein [Coniella lustricola]|uniref:Integral membrane protein S linking to the trans Golgi network-domain-containing protein n=1 Tax=Coniella lustricola TaxID=2025994 RepID=A0A2T2ZT92_9PEZI|nr:integral membrane protein S linking to the trans Golgi network-domain-containing protein [Coniella lustricola]